MPMQASSLTLSVSNSGSLGFQARKRSANVGKQLQCLPTICEGSLLAFAPPLLQNDTPLPADPSSLNGWPSSLADSLSLADHADNAKAVAALLKNAPRSEQQVIFEWLKGALRALALSQHGRLVVQTAFGVASGTDRAALAAELRGAVLELCASAHGHAVLTAFVEAMPAPSTMFVVDEMKGHMVAVATHKYGCEVLQTFIMHGSPLQVETVAAELSAETARLCRHPHGSVVVQCLLEYGSSACQSAIVQHIIPNTSLFAMDKTASHVVEKAMDYADIEEQIPMVTALLESDKFSIADIACSRCGSALLRTIADNHLHAERLRMAVWRASSRLDHSKFGRKVMMSFGLVPHAYTVQSLPCAAVAA